MRPLTLTVEGLRSFRAPVTIPFEGREHIAITGDTGAGKSSILEAMTYALYGRTTFTGQANQEIMNDLATHMRVTLRFTVGGAAFEVTRALRRASDRTVGPAKASLTEFGPEGSEVRKIEQVRQVDARVQEILGLDARAFLRTVVLPQGQFAQLLVGDDPTIRAGILRQVWRTDELTRAGQLADEALVPLGELAAQVAQALDATPQDPAAHLLGLQAEAGRRAAAATGARDRHKAAVDARDALARAHDRTTAAQVYLARIGQFDFATVIAAAEAIARRADGISAERAEAETRQAETRKLLQAVPADDDGLDHQSIGSARALLQSLPSRAASLESAAKRARAEAAQVKEATLRVDGLDKELQTVDSQLGERETERATLSTTTDEAGERLGRAQSLLRAARQAASDAAAFQQQSDEKKRRAGQLREEADRIRQTVLVEAEQRSAHADEELATAQRHNAGAAASAGLRHGDDCPVCSRPLPGDWKPPTAEHLDTAEDSRREARENLEEVRGKIRELATRAEEVDGTQAAELAERATQSRAAATSAAADVATLAGLEELSVSTLPADDDLLRPLATVAATWRERLSEHDTRSQELRDQRTAATASLTAARTALEGTKASLSRSSKDAADAARALRSEVASLPAGLGVDVVLPANPLDVETAQINGIASAGELLNERTWELDRRAEHRQRLRDALDEIGEVFRELRERWDEHVITPGNELTATANRHRDALAKGIAELGMRDMTLPEASSMSDPSRLVDMVGTLRAATSAAVGQARALVETSEAEAKAARQTITRIASEAASPAADPQAADADEVTERAAAEATDAEVGSRAAATAASDFALLVDPLASLQHAGGQLDLTYKVLKDLSTALKPGAFPKWLTLRRSRALLIHASRLLGQMTGGRYAFAEISDDSAEWRIIDNDSNLARTPASLSGGEQFLASLALALGMVEMMARSGGRLESLWLDEGFGSLDRSNLDAAVEALTSAASRGRMVAVITHIRAVADQVDHVLAVTREITGTRAKWLSSSQRAHLAAEDLVAEAADAMSGLLE